jgi:hypothetical protein
MKNFLLFGIATIMLASCVNKNEQQAKDSGREIFFAETTYDYGQIEQDSDGIYIIEFKNLGQDAIIINKVRSSCGCTIPSWPRKPIEQGASGEIEVKYNTALAGSFMKSVYVYSSAKNSPVKLTIKGKVIPTEKTE